MRARKRKLESNSAKVDKHVIQPEEYEEAPEWTDEQFARAEISIGGKVVRPAQGTLTKPGRPPSANPKHAVSLRLDPEILAAFKEDGPGWQTRINDTLAQAVKTRKTSARRGSKRKRA